MQPSLCPLLWSHSLAPSIPATRASSLLLGLAKLFQFSEAPHVLFPPPEALPLTLQLANSC